MFPRPLSLCLGSRTFALKYGEGRYTGAAMSSRSMLSAFACAIFLLPLTARAQALGGSTASQATNSTPGIPKFYAHARQVIVEAEVWTPVDKKHPGDASWIPQSTLANIPLNLRSLFKLLPRPAQGLTLKDFHVFDNGVEQSINYFKEADFAALGGGVTTQWRIDATSSGIWGTVFPSIGGPYTPSSTYLIGYVPPMLQPGECHAIRVVAQNHYVQTGRKQYCAVKSSDAATSLEQTKLGAKMQSFAKSAAQGKIGVSARAFAFWSSGVLSLARENPAASAASVLPATDFTYVVEVHDSKAPATVQVATEFTLPHPVWNYPCPRNAAIYVLGMVYTTTGELERKFGDTFPCDTWDTPMTESFKKIPGEKVPTPSLFDTQIELRPGHYEVLLVVSDGTNFGRGKAPIHVEPFTQNGLSLSDVVLNGIARDASLIVRDATSVTPDPLIPTPLVSKSILPAPVPTAPPLVEEVQFLPVPGAQIWKGNALSAYFEIYEPLLEANKVDVSYSLRNY